MTRIRLSHKIALAVAVLTLACVGGLARPKPFVDAAMGTEWQCSRTAGLVVSCTKG